MHINTQGMKISAKNAVMAVAKLLQTMHGVQSDGSAAGHVAGSAWGYSQGVKTRPTLVLDLQACGIDDECSCAIGQALKAASLSKHFALVALEDTHDTLSQARNHSRGRSPSPTSTSPSVPSSPSSKDRARSPTLQDGVDTSKAGSSAGLTLLEATRTEIGKRMPAISLNLSYNEITDAGVKMLCKAVVANKSLTEGDLRANKISSEGVTMLLNAIQ